MEKLGKETWNHVKEDIYPTQSRKHGMVSTGCGDCVKMANNMFRSTVLYPQPAVKGNCDSCSPEANRGWLCTWHTQLVPQKKNKITGRDKFYPEPLSPKVASMPEVALFSQPEVR